MVLCLTNSAVLKRRQRLDAGGETPPPPQQSLPSAAALSFTFHQQEHDPTSVHCHLYRNGSYHDPLQIPLRNLVVMALGQVKHGKGPIATQKFAGIVFVVFMSSIYSMMKIRSACHS